MRLQTSCRPPSWDRAPTNNRSGRVAVSKSLAVDLHSTPRISAETRARPVGAAINGTGANAQRLINDPWRGRELPALDSIHIWFANRFTESGPLPSLPDGSARARQSTLVRGSAQESTVSLESGPAQGLATGSGLSAVWSLPLRRRAVLPHRVSHWGPSSCRAASRPRGTPA